MGIKGRTMRKRLKKSLRVYLEKMRKVMHGELRPRAIPTPPTPTWLLSACKHPRTRSFAADRRQDPAAEGGGGSGRNGGGGAGDPAATLADVERFLFENFNSLYVDSRDGGGWSPAGSCEVPEDAAPDAPTPQRFFMSPGTSVSPGGEAGRRRSAASGASSSYSGSSSSSPDADDVPATCGCSVAVTTFSVNPYRDFRRSMQEMVDARHTGPHDGEPLDWEFMEELLISCLELNDRRVHKHILGAFTDIAGAFRRRRGRQPTATDARIAGAASEEAWEV